MIFDGIEFSQRRMRPHNPDDHAWVVDAVRVSDGHPLTPQFFAVRELTEAELSEYAAQWCVEWTEKHGQAPHVEPPAVHCAACGIRLISDFDTDYGFDNALWIGLHGGYGMFVDQMPWPNNTEDQWLRGEDGDYVPDADGKAQKDPNWQPTYTPEHQRTLPGQPDHEAVICHTCAHDLCVQVPWLGKIIDPHGSHAHRSKDIPDLLANGHSGWDLDRRKDEHDPASSA